MYVFHHFVCRTAAKMIGLAAVAAAGLVVLALWCFFNDREALQSEQRVRAARDAVTAKITQGRTDVERLSVEVTGARQQLMLGEKNLRELRQLKSTWDWFGGNRQMQQANRARLEQAETAHAQRVRLFRDVEHELRRQEWALGGLEIERDRLDDRLRDDAERRSSYGYLAQRIWLRGRSVVLLMLGLYLIGAVVVPVSLGRRRQRRALA